MESSRTLGECYEYLQNKGDNLFSLLSFPASGGIFSRPVFTALLHEECWDMDTLYKNPYLMRDYIGRWSQRHARTFSKWFAVLNKNYEPLENYDMTESESETTNNTNSTTMGSGTSSTATNTESVVAYDNVGSFSDRNKNAGSTRMENFGTDSGKFDGKRKRDFRKHGNLGVMTTQDMLKQELEVADIDIYQKALDLFKSELLVCVY